MLCYLLPLEAAASSSLLSSSLLLSARFFWTRSGLGGVFACRDLVTTFAGGPSESSELYSELESLWKNPIQLKSNYNTKCNPITHNNVVTLHFHTGKVYTRYRIQNISETTSTKTPSEKSCSDIFQQLLKWKLCIKCRYLKLAGEGEKTQKKPIKVTSVDTKPWDFEFKLFSQCYWTSSCLKRI